MWLTLAAGAYLACKMFMFYLELGMIVLLSPVSFALFGLSTFKEQGLAPIKGVISLLYRALLFGCIFGAYAYVTDSLVDVINNTSWINVAKLPTNISNLIECLLAYPVLLFLAFKSDSIAASLASGSSSMGTGDVAQAAAAGAAAGSAAAAAGSATTGAAGTAPQSMANFMSGLNGGGSIKNAGGMGVGGASPAPFVPPSGPAMSKASTAGTAGASNGTSGGGSTNKVDAAKLSSSSGGGKPNSIASGRYGAEAASGTAGKSTASAASGKGSDSVQAPAAVGEASTASGGSAQDQSESVSVGQAPDSGVAIPDSNNSGVAEHNAPAGAPTMAGAVPAGSDKSVTSSRYGSAESASIGGAPGQMVSPTLEQNLSKIAEQLAATQEPKKPTFSERMGEANRQVAQEHTATHIAMNPHHQD